MTLVIAYLLLYHMDMGTWAYIGVFFVWCFHVWANTQFNQIILDDINKGIRDIIDRLENK